MLVTPDIERFEVLVGQPFELRRDAGTLTLRLASARRSGMPARLGTREPFVLTFNGPPAPLLGQSIYPLAHRELGEIEIFLVPVGCDAAGVRYEAVFG